MTDVIIRTPENPYYTGVKSLDGNMYRLTIRWNTYASIWYLDLKGLNNTVDLKGLAMLPGKDLLAPHGYLELGELWVVDNSEAKANPEFAGMGSRWQLTYTPRSDL